MQSGSGDNKTMQGIFKKSQKSLILRIMGNYGKNSNNSVQNSIEKIEVNNVEDIKISERPLDTKGQEKSHIFEEYPTLSNFLLQVITIINTEKLNIDVPSIVQLFNLLKEYEDNFIKVSYNEISKVGEIIKK